MTAILTRTETTPSVRIVRSTARDVLQPRSKRSNITDRGLSTDQYNRAFAIYLRTVQPIGM